jgi:single-strand DNA-binding protein
VPTANLNRVALTGNLTRDPELRATANGTSVCSLRVAFSTRRKDATSGEWQTKANYADVTVWGTQGETCARYLTKGRPIAIDGRLDWHEWQAQDGSRRQTLSIIADAVQFLASRDHTNGPTSPAAAPEPQLATTSASDDDDIPF